MKWIIILIALVLLIINSVFVYQMELSNKIARENTENIKIEGDVVYLDSLSLRQKIAQMIIVRGDSAENIELNNFNVGGIFLDRQESEEGYKNLIEKYQASSKIKLFVSTDLEGAWNPFSDFHSFPSFSDIEGPEQAYEIGLEHGKLLEEIGFNLNFAPVAEFYDKAYGGRVFSGDKQEINEKLKNYILGLQENVLGTCKHYPGRGMIGNLHHWRDKQNISKEDLGLFETCFENNVSSVMIGHQIVTGEIDSERKPSSISKNVVDTIPDDVLVISDEVNMLGLKSSYLFSKAKMYKDLINYGENVILDFKLSKKSFYNLVRDLEKMVENGEISEERIDESVRKILKAKGYEVKDGR